MTYRFEVEDFRRLYVLEDYYCTNPFCDCNHVTLSLNDKDVPENRFSFLMNFNKTQDTLPNQQALNKERAAIVKEFIKDLPDELLVLFKQRYTEAKAYGEKNPMSYLLFESGRYTNFIEIAPRSSELLDFKYEDEKHFAEDSYEIDPRNDNRDVQLTFYKFDPNDEKLPPIFMHTYYFSEKKREKEDAKLTLEQSDMLVEFHRFIPNLNDILKGRYKKVKTIGAELLQTAPKDKIDLQKTQRNALCPCGSGKKFKKCCGLKMH